MERKVGEGCLLVWGRLLKRRCLSEQRPSTISLLHLFVSWANLSSVVQACPQEILNLYILSPGYFEGGGGLFSVCPGDSNSRLSSYQYLDVPSRLGQSILTSFDWFVSEWVPYQIFPMGTRLLLCLSVLLSDFFLKLLSAFSKVRHKRVCYGVSLWNHSYGMCWRFFFRWPIDTNLFAKLFSRHTMEGSEWWYRVTMIF